MLPSSFEKWEASGWHAMRKGRMSLRSVAFDAFFAVENWRCLWFALLIVDVDDKGGLFANDVL